jgi:PIN domain nuclease of toxin-antitoxin system
VIVLDTHAWIWWHSSPERLSDRARNAVDETDRLGVSAFSAWELAMLVEERRLELDRDVRAWARQALAHPRSVTIPVTAEIGLAAALLDAPELRDPADRIIYVSAAEAGVRLITRDETMRRFDPARVVW